ncbi:tetratricopeptide repeat protein [Amycolatopsis pittospori]|uniref:tetratricopeptide repeat protein n=1 Tax=Amycolatopsis pittospori TaxID=2749434 RepID=UPI0015F03249|nr:tetratricopeptide repeat protein [Amycolatopsis pittospori]
MSRPDGRSSIQDIARARLSDGFVGRVGEREDFRANLALPGSDRRRRYLFSVHGLAGVGKTFLLEQLRGIAEESRALVGFADDRLQDLPATLVKLAKDLARGGHEMRRFEKRYESYLKARERLRSDPQAPAAGRALVTKTVVKAGLGVAKTLPGGSIAADAIDADATAKQLEQLQSYLAAKFKRKADVQLLLDPAEELTKPFVEDLWRLPESRQITLFFDTFERTAPVLGTWLLDLFGGRYGDLPQNLVLTVAGQFPLDEAKWNRYAPLVREIELRPFTEPEARRLLAEHGITDEQVIEIVLRLTDGLPVLVAMLAERKPTGADAVGDPGDDAVKRFLHWVPEEAKQKIAATASLPRVLDEDVLGVLTGKETAGETFRWLRELPFVGRRELPVRYHPVVRGPMVRMERGRSPGEFAEHHRKLAEYYEGRCTELGHSRHRDAWTDERWQRRKLEQTYHRLCGDPAEALPDALLGAAEMITTSTAAARTWARMMEQAGIDADEPAVLRWAQRLAEAVGGDDGAREVEVLDLLAGAGELDAARLSTVIRRRAWAHEGRDELEATKRDYDRALDLNPADPYVWSDRGNFLRNEADWAPALEDLNRAIELDPTYAYSWRGRGSARAELGDLDGAMTDLDEAVRLQPDHAWAYTARSEVHYKRGELRKAIDELEIAIRLDPDYAWAINYRAVLLAELGETDEALAGYRAAAALRPKDVYYLAELAWFLVKIGDDDGASKVFDAAVAAEPGSARPHAIRAAFHRRKERHRLAIDGFTTALRIDPDYEWAYYMRGLVHDDLGDRQAALADFDRAVELAPEDAENHLWRGMTLSRLKRNSEAVEGLSRAIELDPENAWAYTWRAMAHQRSGDHRAALIDLGVALEASPSTSFFHVTRAESLAKLDRHEEARAELDEGVRLGEDGGYAYYQRAHHRVLFGDLSGALSDVDNAPADGHDESGRALRAEIHRCAGDYGKAIEELRELIALDPDDTEYRGNLGETLLFAGKPDEAKEVLRPFASQSLWIRNLLALADLKTGRTEEARRQLGEALEKVLADVAADPGDWDAKAQPLFYLLALGRADDAKRDLVKLLEEGPPQGTRLDLLRDLKETGQLLPELGDVIDELTALIPRPVLNRPGA